MKKQGVVTLTAAAVLAGVAVTNSSVQADTNTANNGTVQKKTTTTAVTQAKSTVSAAQQEVKTAQANVSKAQASVANAAAAKSSAQSTLTAASSSASSATTAQSTAQQYKDAATSEGIDKAQSAVDSAQTQTNAAQQAASSAQQSVSAAQTDVSAKSSAASTANSAVTAKQQVVSSAQTQVDKDQAATSLATAQTAASNAQSAVDQTNDQIKSVTGDAEQAGIVLSQSYVDAYKDSLNDNGDDDTVMDRLENEVDNFETTAQITEYQPTTKDSNEVVDDVSNLTYAQAKSLTDFAASVINGLRAQVGSDPVQVTYGSVQAIMLAVAQEEKEDFDAFTEGSLAEMNSEAWWDTDFSTLGVKMTAYSETEPGAGKYEIGLDGWDLPTWQLYSTKNHTMAELKGGVYDDIQTLLKTQTGASNLLGQKLPDDMKGEYLGATFDSYGTLHLFFIDNYDASKIAAEEAQDASDDGASSGSSLLSGHEIPADAVFFKDTTTPAPFEIKSSSDTDSQETLTDLQTKLSTEQTKLTAANKALASAQLAAKDLGVTASDADAAQLAADQSKLATAKTELASAQKLVTTTKAALAEAQATLDAAQTQQATATKALSEAKATLKAAQQYLNNLQNADTNLTDAQATVTKAQANLLAAQKAYDATLAPVQTAQTALEAAKAALAVAKERLTTAQATLSKYQVVNGSKEDVTFSSNKSGKAQKVTLADKTTKSAAVVNKGKKAILQKQAVATTLPQTNSQDQGYLALLGMALLSLIGFAGVGRKRRI
ncbi:SEC10/PgrA surface exclusion domain-containing protein [Pediococcus siamensis]|uniref:LPXTG cell wall anchor domain-containing protein n=1 Tax=Pediococcus siamensis TaxID=381829 RepID=UPI0039A2E87F